MALDTLHPSKGPGFQPLDADLTALSAVSLSRLISTPPSTSSEDWNSLTTAGHHSKLMRGNQANGPGDTDYYFVEVRTYASGGELVQIGYPYALGVVGVGRNAIIIRTRYQNTWSPWRRIIAQEDKPAFDAYMATAQGQGVVPFSSVNVNVGSCYNAGNGRFTAHVSGTYLFNTALFIDTHSSSTQYGFINFRKNGSSTPHTFHGEYGSVQYYYTINASVIMSLSAGDYVDVYFGNGGSSSTLYAGSYNSFNGHML